MTRAGLLFIPIYMDAFVPSIQANRGIGEPGEQFTND